MVNLSMGLCLPRSLLLKPGFSRTLFAGPLATTPEILQQGFTGVNPDFRGKNLGRLMKAAMFEKILRERPVVKILRTGNS